MREIVEVLKFKRDLNEDALNEFKRDLNEDA